MSTLPADIGDIQNIELRASQAGSLLGCSQITVRKLGRTGLIPFFQSPGGMLFRLGDVVRYRDSCIRQYGRVRRPSGRPRKTTTDVTTA